MYTYNENGVCTNPTPFLHRQTKEHHVTLKIAQLPNGAWTYGYHFGVNFGNHSGCAGPASIHGPQYPTPEEAKHHATAHYTSRIHAMIQSAKEYNHAHTQHTQATQPPKKTAQTTLF